MLRTALVSAPPDEPRPPSATPLSPPPPEPVIQASPRDEAEARERIDALEREARSLGPVPAAALLFHEAGLLWESPLRQPRNAAIAYQNAFKLAPRFLANLRDARRLFAQVGNWAMVVQLIDAELAVTEARRARAALLFEQARVLSQRLSRDTDAASALDACLALEPADVTLLVQLEQAFGARGDTEALVKIYQLLARAVDGDQARAAYLTSAGLLLEERLKRPTEAAALFREAFAIERGDPQLIAAIRRVAQREGAVDEELEALAAQAELEGAAAAPTFMQISKAYERLGRDDDAVAALLAAHRVSPTDPLVLSELARHYEASGQLAELAAVLLAWVSLSTEESELVATNLHLASLYEQLGRDADAVGRYRAVLQRVPHHSGALTGLGRLHHRAQDWQGLSDICEAEVAATDEPQQKAARLYKAAETLEERLGRVDDAIARLVQCLTLAPGFLPAQRSLARLYEKLGRWRELVAMHEQELTQQPDLEQRITTLHTMAVLHEDRLGDVPSAIACLERVLALSPNHVATMGSLARLYEKAERWKELLALNEAEGRLANDTRQVVSIAHRSAEILEDQLRDRPAAITAWERVLQLSPAYLPALRALGRLYGQEGRWEALIRMYRSEAEIAPSTEQAAALTQKVGELYEQRLKDTNQAISAYRDVLTLAPRYFPALRALARIYRAQGEWENLIEVLRAEAANRADPVERANALFQAAAIWEDHLRQPEKALQAYREVVQLAPGHTTAMQQLERLLSATDDAAQLVALYEQQTRAGSDAARASAWLRLALVYVDRLNEPDRAAGCCEQALALEPRNLQALRLMERVMAGNTARSAELRTRIAEAIGDRKLAVALRLSSVDGGGADDTGATALLAELQAAFADDPTDEALGLALERALQAAGDAAGLVALYERRRALTTDSMDLLQLTLRIADLNEARRGDFEAAAAAYRAALESAPELLPALQGLVRCATRLGQHVAAREALVTLAGATRDPALSTRAMLEAARVARELERDDDIAAGLLQRILARDPLQPDAGRMLDELLASRGGVEDLLALHERRGDMRAAQRDLPGAAAELFEAARIAVDHLGDRARAGRLLEKLLLLLPAHADALELKGRLAFEAGSFAEAAAAWSVRVQLGGDPARLATLHLDLGLLYDERLGDAARAATHLKAVLAIDRANARALERLARLHGAARSWNDAADCLRRLLELELPPAKRLELTQQLAHLVDREFQDFGQAITLQRRALELAPDDGAALDHLASLYERTGSLQDLVQLLEAKAARAEDPAKASALRLRIAGLYEGPLGDPPRAIATYRAVVDSEPGNVAGLVALAGLYGRDPSSSQLAIEMHRHLLRLEPARVESFRALFRLWESARQFDKAFCAAAVLSFFKAANDTEAAFYTEGRQRLGNEFRGSLVASDLGVLHPAPARHPIVDVLRVIGDQLGRVFPPELEQAGIDRKADRLKAEHAVFKAVEAVTSLFFVEEFEAYQAKRGLVYLEATEPPAVCVGPDVVRRLTLREQRFLYGRAAMGLLDKTAALRKLSAGEFSDVLGNAVRIHLPDWDGLGRRNEELSKQLRKALSRKAVKLLEDPSRAVAAAPPAAIEPIIQGLSSAADRAGLLVAADPSAALGVMAREEGLHGQPAPDSADAVARAVLQRPELRDLLTFALSEDFFRLRQRLGVALGGGA